MSKSKRGFWILSHLNIVLLLVTAGQEVQTQSVIFEVNTIPLKGELINFTGTSMLQDSEGFLWFGSEEGLYRYHGSGMKIYRREARNQKSILDNHVMKLYEDKEGLLWVGTREGLCCYDRITESFTRYQLGIGDSATRISNLVYDIVEDKDGYLWLASGSGFSRFDKTCRITRNYKIPAEYISRLEPRIPVFSLGFDKENYLWISSTEGLHRFDTESESIELITDSFFTSGLFADRNGMIWHQGTEGLYRSDRNEPAIKRYLDNPDEGMPLKDQRIHRMLEDESGDLWIQTNKGIYCYTKDLKFLFHLEHSEEYNPIADYRLIPGAMMLDNTGALWYYTMDGIHQIIKKKSNFRLYNSHQVLNSQVNSIYLENDNMIWIANNLGIFTLDQSNNRVTQYYGEPQRLSGNPYMTRQIFRDRGGRFWISTDFDGIYNIIREEDSVLRVEALNPGPYDSTGRCQINLYRARVFFEDSRGRIWVYSERSPVCYYDEENNLLVRVVSNPSSKDTLPGNRNSIFQELGRDTLLAAGSFGIFRLIPPFIRISDDEIMPSEVIKCRAVGDEGKLVELPPPVTSCLDSSGTLWLGTLKFGLVKVTGLRTPGNGEKELRMQSFTTDQGLSDNRVHSMIDDGRGNLWLGTRMGLSKFNIQSETFTNYFVRHGLPHNYFFSQSADKSKDGELFFGTQEGMISFNPDSFLVNERAAPVKLVDLRIHNRAVNPGENSGLTRAIVQTEEIELHHNQNYLSFEFAILNYIHADLNQYRYMLEGLDDEWIYSGTRNFVNYSNLEPGNYTFHAAGADNEGIWNPDGVKLGIHIHHPPWRMWWAYLIYGCVLTGIIFWYRRFLLHRASLRIAVEVANVSKEKVLEIERMKSRFLADVSHEFRTPLTLILGPIEDLSKRNTKRLEISHDLIDIIHRNASRLQRLINQLLDISKMETGNLSLQVSEGDLEAFVRTIILSFLSLAESKQIRYVYDLPEKAQGVYFDPDKVEKILTNLISNAFKNSISGGEVKVSLQYAASPGFEKYVRINVSDTGRGIPPDKLEKIFERFYRVDHSISGRDEGSGIGLALTKELVELCHGEIQVESESGRGSTFIVILPVSAEQFREEEIMIPAEEPSTKSTGQGSPSEEPDTDPGKPPAGIQNERWSETGSKQDQEKALDTPHVLIVEDNEDLRNYITGILGNSYRLLTAENGEQGLEKAIQNIPDLIINDVMMPVMDGMELCRCLKEDNRTNHIPVIMLTARADRGSKLEGLGIGADAYIIKPFDAEELNVRVMNLIGQRRKIREHFRREFLTNLADYEIPAPEDEFMTRLHDCMKKHLTESEFNVEQLGKKMSLSRTQLYRKILALTDHTPSEFIRNTRLKMAARMFMEGHKNVTRVMLSVGFDTSVHFARYFRELFGSNPSEYIKQKTQPGK